MDQPTWIKLRLKTAFISNFYSIVSPPIISGRIFRGMGKRISVAKKSSWHPDVDVYIARKVSKYGVISGPYFPAFGLNTEIYSFYLCIQSEYRKIQVRKTSVFGHFSRSDIFRNVHGMMTIYISTSKRYR